MSYCNRNKKKKVLLMSMPWNGCNEPSLGGGILKSVLLNNNIECDIFDATMKLLRYVKHETYSRIANLWIISDFMFTHVFESNVSERQLESLSKLIINSESIKYQFLELKYKEKYIDLVLRFRQEIIPRFLDDLVEEIDFDEYSMVGFTCLFDQTIASLALAKKIKQLYPDMFIAFGGKAIAQPIGPALQRSFPEMDVVSYGDGEPVIVPLVEAACGERHLREVPNITYRNDKGEVVESDITSTIDLNDSPTPNYDDFFRNLRTLWEKDKIRLKEEQIPIESSRGCWWGRKASCIFCSYNNHKNQKHYRAKSGKVVISQLNKLSSKYCDKSNPFSFRFHDSIMPLEYYKDLLPKLEKDKKDFSIQYEIKSNIRWDQMGQLQRAGVKYIQPGIESFNTPLLKYIRKGVTGIQNIFTIFSAMCHEMYCLYNILWKFPGEQITYYEDMLKLVPGLYHLIPPMTTMPIQFLRYSDLVENPQKYGMKPLKPHWGYDTLFSLDFCQKNNICFEDICFYYFDAAAKPVSQNRQAIYNVFQHQMIQWEERYKSRKARLSYKENNGVMSVYDSRHQNEPVIYEFGKEAELLRKTMFGKICREQELFESMLEKGVQRKKIDSLLDKLCELRIVIKEENKYLWIAFSEEFYKSGTKFMYGLKSTPETHDVEKGEKPLTQNLKI